MRTHVNITCLVSGFPVHQLCAIENIVNQTEFSFFNLSTRKEGYFKEGECTYRVCSRELLYQGCTVSDDLSEIPVEVMERYGLVEKKNPEISVEQFQILGELLHGKEKWKDPLARDLVVNRSTIEKFSKGSPIKGSISKECVGLLKVKYDQIGELLNQLGSNQ